MGGILDLRFQNRKTGPSSVTTLRRVDRMPVLRGWLGEFHRWFFEGVRRDAEHHTRDACGPRNFEFYYHCKTEEKLTVMFSVEAPGGGPLAKQIF